MDICGVRLLPKTNVSFCITSKVFVKSNPYTSDNNIFTNKQKSTINTEINIAKQIFAKHQSCLQSNFIITFSSKLFCSGLKMSEANRAIVKNKI